MKANFNLKDFIDISAKFDILTVAKRYVVTAYTNNLEGNINAYIKIDDSENDSLGKPVLFCIRSGEQIFLNDLTAEEQLVIPDAYLAHIKEALSVKLEILQNNESIWESIIKKINYKHSSDTNNNFVTIPTDLPIPDFKYITIEKKSFFNKLVDKFKKNKEA